MVNTISSIFKTAMAPGPSRGWIEDYVASQSGTIQSTTITDPAINASVTTVIIDDYSGVIITLTGAGNAQTIQDPTTITTNKEFIVANNDTSTDPITVNSVVIAPGEAQKFYWDGSAWLTLEAISASQTSFTPTGSITASNVQTAIAEVDSEKAAKSNVLELDNASAFTPNADYEPATKKYVDDLSTNLSEGTATTTTVDVNSSNGGNATLVSASTSRAGLLTKAKFDEIAANTAKVSDVNHNVPTALSVGTVGISTVGITSDGGVDDVILPAATNTVAGVATAAQITAIEANTAKETNIIQSATDVNTDVTNFDGLLSATDTTVQLALETLNHIKLLKIAHPATGTLSVDNMSGTLISNYGQTVENTITLDTCVDELSFLFQIEATGVGNVHIKAGSTDKFYFDGVALDDGDKITCTAPAIGDFISFWTIRTGASSFDWIAESGRGSWSDGGA